MKTIITYGTFDLFHVGHLNLLRRLRELGDKLIVGVSSDDFNLLKGKQTVIPFSDRLEIVKSIRYVDMAFPEECWDQKVNDINKYDVDIFGMGMDWYGKFDFLEPHCQVVYLKRTEGVSSTGIKSIMKKL